MDVSVLREKPPSFMDRQIIHICQLWKNHTFHAEVAVDKLSDVFQKEGVFNPKSLANAITTASQCLAKLPKNDKSIFRLVQQWQLRAGTALKQEHFGARALSSSLHALAEIGIKPTESFIALWYTSAKNLFAQGRDTFNPQDLTTSIKALGMLGMEPEEGYLNSWYSHAIQRLKCDQFNPKELATILYAFGRLSKVPSKAFLQAWYETAEIALKKDLFNEQELCNTLYAFSRIFISMDALEFHELQSRDLLGVFPKMGFLEIWFEVASKRLNGFNAHAIANVTYALGVLRILPTKEFLQKLFGLLEKTCPDFNEQGLSSVFYGLGQLGCKVPEALIRKAQEMSLTVATYPNFCSILYSLARMEINPSELINKIETLQVNLLKENELHQLYQALRIFKVAATPLLQERFSLMLNRGSIPNTSISQCSLASLCKAYIEPYVLIEEYWMDSICAHVDLAVPEKKLLIQFEGPSHFIYDVQMKIMKRLENPIQNRLLREEGWIILFVTYLEWQKNAKRHELIEGLLAPYFKKEKL